MTDMIRQAHHDTLQTLCSRYRLRVVFADLGDWGRDELRAEYDPDEAEIRVNRRLPAELVPLAIAHELYHHLRGDRRDRGACAAAAHGKPRPTRFL